MTVQEVTEVVTTLSTIVVGGPQITCIWLIFPNQVSRQLLSVIQYIYNYQRLF